MGGFFSTPALPKRPKISRKGKKGKKAAKGKKGKKGGKSRYEDEAYEDEFTEERVMSGFVPGVYMTDNYAPPPGSHGSVPTTVGAPIPMAAPPPPATGLPASITKTTRPTKPPTAGKSPFDNWPVSGALSDAFPVSNFANNQPSLPGVNLADATPLSPMTERMDRVVYPINFSMALLVILFIVFVMMRK